MGACSCFIRKTKYSKKPSNKIVTSSMLVPSDQLILKRVRSENSSKRKNPIIDARPHPLRTPEKLKGKWIRGSPGPSEIPHILKTLRSHFILKHLDSERHFKIIKDMQEYETPPNEAIIRQGDAGHYFFILIHGKVEITVNGEHKCILTPHTCIGELALLDDAPRSATVTTLEQCRCWVLDRASFKSAVRQVNQSQMEETRKFIASVPLFESLTIHQKNQLLEFVNYQQWDYGQSIVREGEPGVLLYIITEGTVVCTKNQKELRRLGRGEIFGEQAILHSSSRSATVTAMDSVTVLSISSDNLIRCFGEQLEKVLFKNSINIALENSPVLSCLTPSQQDRLRDRMAIRTYQNAEVVVHSGSIKGSCLWIVLKGALQNSVEKLMCFGDLELTTGLSNELHGVDYIANGITVVAEISRADVEDALGGQLYFIQNLNSAVSALLGVPLFKRLPHSKVTLLAQTLEQVSFTSGDKIVEEGEEGESFYIIKQGTADILKEQTKLRSIGEFSYFGERALLRSEVRSASVVATSEVICWRIHKTDFLEIIDTNIHKQLIKRMELQDDSVQMDDLIPIKTLGSGMSAQVYLCANKKSKTLYALKAVSKEFIETQELRSAMVAERNILLKIDHPLIMKLVKTFKDPARVFFLTEFVSGVDLFDAIRHIGILSENDALFYTTCLILIIEHLHDKSILYRDLKPENVMIDSEGYPKLIDMGAAKEVDGRTYTSIGTPHYMAPEVIIGSGYGLSADWWSLGIILYEFLYGDVPFGGQFDDPALIYNSVLRHKLVFPMETQSFPVNDLIENLLDPHPYLRAKNLRSFKWLEGFNWDGLIARDRKPPYFPKIQDFSFEIQRKAVMNQSLREFIANEEGRSPKNRVSDWDAEF